MAEILILEGSRMQWKSTIAQGLRQMTEGSTLINFTGFKLDGPEGLEKVSTYYQSFIELFSHLPADATIICDRIFFSEMVYSRLYKTYDFSREFLALMFMLSNPNNRVRIYHLTASQDALKARLGREKIALFGHIEDSLNELLKQRDQYRETMDYAEHFYANHENVSIKCIDTSEFSSSKEVRDHILKDFN